jgi:hypothetical protein
MNSRLRITPSGTIHFEWALNNTSYLTEAALTTPIRSGQLKDELIALWVVAGKKGREDWDKLIRKFAEYCLEQDSVFVVVPNDNSYNSQKTIRDQFRNRWVPKDVY